MQVNQVRLSSPLALPQYLVSCKLKPFGMMVLNQVTSTSTNDNNIDNKSIMRHCQLMLKPPHCSYI